MSFYKKYLTETDVLTSEDMVHLLELKKLYALSAQINANKTTPPSEMQKDQLVAQYRQIGSVMHQYLKDIPQILVHNFNSPKITHPEVSRVVAKLRHINTNKSEFIYYIQRAYEILFNFAFCSPLKHTEKKQDNFFIVPTPTQSLAVHNIPNIDHILSNTVLCTALRGSMLPSMIVSKEIEENTLSAFTTPFALFNVKRLENDPANLAYQLDIDRSYFQLEQLQGKDWIFADPLNATGGTIYTIIQYLKSLNIHPRYIYCFHILSSMQGCLTLARAFPNSRVFTLWLDPTLNQHNYVLPGLGDAGDRLSGTKRGNILQLIANYGSNVVNLYHHQVEQIEKLLF